MAKPKKMFKKPVQPESDEVPEQEFVVEAAPVEETESEESDDW